MRFSSFGRVLIVAGPLGAFACTNVLGDFETAPGVGGSGGTAECSAPSDCTLDGVDAACAEATCTDGACGTKTLPKGSECSKDGKRCDGAGHCVDCLDTSDCEKGKCVEGTCEVGVLGGLCGSPKDCDSGFCVQGVCCSADCSGACEACNLPMKEGSCETAPLGAIGEPACAPYLCNGASGACPKACAKDEECVSGRYCEASAATCELQKASGDACTKDAMCAAGDCYQGSCCKPGCACGTCTSGTCQVTAAPGTDPNKECGTGTCDGIAGCSTKGAPVFVFAPDASAGAVRPFGLAVTPDGSAVIVGEFEGNVVFGKTALVSSGGVDGFVMQLTPDGEVAWAIRIGDVSGSATQSARAVTVSKGGVIYVAGQYATSAKVGGTSYLAKSKQEVFLATLDSAGKVVDSGNFVGADALAAAIPVGIALDSLGAVIVGGSFSGKVDFGGVTLVASALDGFVVRTKPEFVGLQALRLGGSGDDVVESIAMSPKNALAVVGSFKSPAGGGFKLAGKDLASAGDSDIFVANLGVSSLGFAETFAGAYGSTGVDRARAVALGKSDEVYVTGSKTAGVSFSGNSIPPIVPQNGDPFVVALSTKGSHFWTQGYPTTSADTGRALAVDALGFVLFGGDFGSTLTLKSGLAFTSTQASFDPFVAKLHPTAGAAIWGLVGTGSAGLDELVALGTTPERDVIAVGAYRGELVLGGKALPPATDKAPAMFVLRAAQ